MTFQAIRSPTGQHSFSWNVNLENGQQLEMNGTEYAQVTYSNGVRAFLITAEPAHDAVGTSVPTTLSVAGSVLTIDVDLSSSKIVYPAIAGQGWEGGYAVPIMVQGPEDEAEVKDREKREREARELEIAGEFTPSPPANGFFSKSEAERMAELRAVGSEVIPAPEPAPSGSGATASRFPTKTVKPLGVCQIDSCSNDWVEIRNPSYFMLTSRTGMPQNGSLGPRFTVSGGGTGFIRRRWRSKATGVVLPVQTLSAAGNQTLGYGNR